MKKGNLLCLAAAIAIAATTVSGQNNDRLRVVNHTNKTGQKPVGGDEVTADFYVYLKDKVIQTTKHQGQPAQFQLPTAADMGAAPLPATIAALMMLAVGDSASTFERIDSLTQPLPPDFAGEKELRIDIVLHKIKLKAEMDAEMAAKGIRAAEHKARVPLVEADVRAFLEKYNSKGYGDALKKTATGLEYVILEPGRGAMVKKGEPLAVHYWGCLKTGKRFDDSFSRGEPIEFPVGQGMVIPGWDEGLQLLNHGAMAVFFIPTKLAYDQNSPTPDIPAGADLVFYVEVQ